MSPSGVAGQVWCEPCNGVVSTCCQCYYGAGTPPPPACYYDPCGQFPPPPPPPPRPPSPPPPMPPLPPLSQSDPCTSSCDPVKADPPGSDYASGSEAVVEVRVRRGMGGGSWQKLVSRSGKWEAEQPWLYLSRAPIVAT